MWATFPNRKMELLPGSFVTVQLYAETQQNMRRISVLPSAIIMENGKCFVWVLDPKTNIPQRRQVKTGDTVNGRTVILDGVKMGETVVVDGTHKIRNGAPVIPVDARKLFKQGR